MVIFLVILEIIFLNQKQLIYEIFTINLYGFIIDKLRQNGIYNNGL